MIEWIQRKNTERKDRLFVIKNFHQTKFLNDPQLKKQTWEDKKKMNGPSLHQLFTLQYD